MKYLILTAWMTLACPAFAHAAPIEILYCKSEMSVLTLTKGKEEYILSLNHPVTREQILEIYKGIEVSEAQLNKLLAQPVQNLIPTDQRYFTAGHSDASVLKNGFKLTGINGSVSFAYNDRRGIDLVFVTRYGTGAQAQTRTSRMPFGRIERSTCSLTRGW